VYVAKNKLVPSQYFKKNIFFTIETEEPELADSIELLGASQFLFATDYPHDDLGGRMKHKDVQLLHGNPRISDAAKDAIFAHNLNAVLGQR
jgi:predicted TIM-barrel fold metal-dependent hydrolase